MMVELSITSTALNRCNTGTATGSAAITSATAAARTRPKHSAARGVNRWNRAGGLIGVPKVAAVWVKAHRLGIRVRQPPENQGLREDASGEFGTPLHQSRLSGGLIRAGPEHRAHGLGHFWYTGHWEAPVAIAVDTNHHLTGSFPLVSPPLNLMPMGRMIIRPYG